MSTRYIWDKYNVNFVENKVSIQGYTYNFKQTAAGTDTVAMSGTKYKIGMPYPAKEPVFRVSNDRYETGKPQSTVDGRGGMAGIPSDKFFLPLENYTSMFDKVMLSLPEGTNNNTTWMYDRNGLSVNVYVHDLSVELGQRLRSFYKHTVIPDSQSKGELIGLASSSSRSKYSDNGVTDFSWYVYKGSDEIDPTNVTYSKSELVPGESITINASYRAPTYGGTVFYQYQYSVDGGGTWIDAGSKTTARSATVTIPGNAQQFQARVQASDDYGFISSTYVYGPTLSLTQFKAYVGIGGKARAVTKIYVGVNGKAREVVKGYVGVAGKARRFL